MNARGIATVLWIKLAFPRLAKIHVLKHHVDLMLYVMLSITRPYANVPLACKAIQLSAVMLWVAFMMGTAALGNLAILICRNVFLFVCKILVQMVLFVILKTTGRTASAHPLLKEMVLHFVKLVRFYASSSLPWHISLLIFSKNTKWAWMQNWPRLSWSSVLHWWKMPRSLQSQKTMSAKPNLCYWGGTFWQKVCWLQVSGWICNI